jgi:hypothetical protein
MWSVRAAADPRMASREWQLLSAYATIVRRVADERGCPLVDLRATFARALLGLRPRRYCHGKIDAATLSAAGGDYDQVARRCGYRLVCDGIHLSTRGAELAATEVYHWMREV